MRYYKIEIDERIWNYLKKQAEPFLDTPNSVLYRLLFQAHHRNEKDIDRSPNSTSALHEKTSNADKSLSLEETNLLETIDIEQNIQTSDNRFIASLKSSDISQALSQILEVLYEIKINGLTRKDATQIVAQRRGTSPFTVMDKYCRQLNKKSSEIDELLSKDEGMKEIQALLNDKFPKHTKVINDFFQRLI